MPDSRGTLAFSTGADVDAALPRALSQLRADRLIAYPTETTYGLGSRITREAVERLVALKGRAGDKPFLLLIDGLDMLDTLALDLPSGAARFASRFWPGPLTLVLPRAGVPASRVPGGPAGSIAVRHTSHEGARRIIRALGEPITSTSANSTGLPPATTAAEIVTRWGEAVARGDLLVLDGGVLAASQPSTVVDCSGPRSRVIRVGAIGLDALRAVDPGLRGET